MPIRVLLVTLAPILFGSCASNLMGSWSPSVALTAQGDHSAEVKIRPENPQISRVSSGFRSSGIEIGATLRSPRIPGDAAGSEKAVGFIGFQAEQGEISGEVVQVIPGGAEFGQGFGWDFRRVGVTGRWYLPAPALVAGGFSWLSAYVTAGIDVTDVEYRSSSALFDVLGPQVGGTLGVGLELTPTLPISPWLPSAFLEASENHVLSGSQDIQGKVSVTTEAGRMRFGLRWVF